jgi:hypothetical protein
MDIAAFISELLEHENDLIVPGLGLFYRSRVAGYYSKELQQFYPPTLQLLFNPDVIEDDGKMVSLLMADQHINLSTARTAIAEFVSQLLMQASKANVGIGNLGTLSSRRNKLVFAARRLTNNNEIFYGLVPVKLKRNAAVTQKPVVVQPDLAITATETTSFSSTLLPVEPVKDTVQLEQNTTYINEDADEPRRSTNWVLVAALLLLIAGLSLLGAYKYRPDLFTKYTGGNPPLPANDLSIRRHRSDSVKAMIQAQKDIGLKPKIDAETNEQIETPVDTFAIVIATIKNYASAQKELDRYRYKGFNVEMRRLPFTNNWYQIDIAAYFNADSARAHLPEFKAKLTQNDLTVQKYPYKAK